MNTTNDLGRIGLDMLETVADYYLTTRGITNVTPEIADSLGRHIVKNWDFIVAGYIKALEQVAA